MILNKDVLVNNIVTELSDNSTGQISPYDIRHNLLDIIDSVHLLTKGKELEGSNFGTPDTRSTRVGKDSLSKIDLAGYFSIDNTSVGYSSLKNNYQSFKNTAIGSHSLFCNIYGENNAALGYNSLGGNTVGHGNVGLGNFTLNNNKGGSFNIAIGHGAGYYAKNVDNKLFIASHNVDSTYICDNPEGMGLVPLVYGDLDSLKFGIGVTTLHNDAVLQVGGHISSSLDDSHNLGSPNYRFKNIYLSSGIYFGSNLYLSKYDNASLGINANFVPKNHDLYSLGSSDNLWNFGYFHNLYVSGVATLHRFNAIESCNYFCKTINLASSGNISLDGGGPETLYDYAHEQSPIVSECGYLNDQQLTGAGFVIQSSGADYLRQYGFTFVPSGDHVDCPQEENAYSKSFWSSDISIHLASGTHILSDRLIFPSSINIVNDSGCFGIFSKEDDLFFSKEDILYRTGHPSGYLAGVGNVNFYAQSGNLNDYVINFSAPESGVNIKQRFLNGIKSKNIDSLNLDKDILNGFEIQSIDDSNNFSFGPIADRMVIGSYSNSSNIINALTLMKSDSDDGILGITNLTPNSEYILPETSLNVRSSSNAIGRFTAENQSSSISAIQLLGGSNCLENGIEFSYLNGSGLADISTYVDSGKNIFFRFYDNNTLGLFTSSGTKPTVGDMFTMGDSENDYALISMHENNQTIDSRTNYAKIYVKQKVKPNQTQTVYVTDDGGNLHDLIINTFDVTDGRGLYTDSLGNTFGGLYCPKDRTSLTSNYNNTGIGSGVLYNITSGDDNSIFGTNSGSGITSGSRNNIFGANSANSITNGNNNLVYGQNSLVNSAADSSSNIIIGNGIGENINDTHNFIIGQYSNILLKGKIGPNNSDKYIAMPSGGKFGIYDQQEAYSLWIEPDSLSFTEYGFGNDYPETPFSFNFVGEKTSTLFYLNHSSDPMTNSFVYKTPITARPYFQLEGDFRLRGAIRFSDFSSLESASFLDDIENLQTDVEKNKTDISYLYESFVEGYVKNIINAPSDSSNPTTGKLHLKNKNWEDVGEIDLVNRDTTSVIHAGAYVIAIRVNDEFRPLWISASDTKCQCCR